MKPKNAQTRRLTWHDATALVGFIIGFTGFVEAVATGRFPFWLSVPSILVMLGCGIYFARSLGPLIAGWIHPRLVVASPWLLSLVLILCVVTAVHVWPVRTPRHIIFYANRCGVFKSQDHREGHGNYLWVDSPWTTMDEGRTGGFSYRTNPTEKPSQVASAGGYMTFYTEPCDRLAFETLRFRCKATDANGVADVGIRLAVDDPKLTGDRELATYEVKSLRAYGQIDATWRTFEIPLGAFEPSRNEPPFPRGLDANTINKLVFYVDARIAASCPQATLWFRDICFLP